MAIAPGKQFLQTQSAAHSIDAEHASDNVFMVCTDDTSRQGRKSGIKTPVLTFHRMSVQLVNDDGRWLLPGMLFMSL